MLTMIGVACIGFGSWQISRYMHEDPARMAAFMDWMRRTLGMQRG